jgi:hypothetical protein
MMQRDRVPCDCGGTVIVTPTDSPFEFDLRCADCGYWAWQSYAHYNKPPMFQRTAQQQELFDGTP